MLVVVVMATMAAAVPNYNGSGDIVDLGEPGTQAPPPMRYDGGQPLRVGVILETGADELVWRLFSDTLYAGRKLDLGPVPGPQPLIPHNPLAGSFADACCARQQR